MSPSHWERWAGGLFRSLGSRPYRSYFFGQGLSLLGTWMQHAALGWLAFSFMEQSKWPAWVQAAQLLPCVVIGPIAGKLIDRVSKRSLILVTQMGLAILALILALTAHWNLLDPYTLLLWDCTKRFPRPMAILGSLKNSCPMGCLWRVCRFFLPMNIQPTHFPSRNLQLDRIFVDPKPHRTNTV